MSLDLSQVALQLDTLASRLKTRQGEWKDRLGQALETLGRADVEVIRSKAEASRGKVTWLVPRLTTGLNGGIASPPAPQDYIAVAVDGSHIDVDRHHAGRCYLINIGAVVLSYGPDPGAQLWSHPRLYSEEEDLAIREPQGTREQPIEGAVLGLRRSVEEVKALAELVQDLPGERPVLALLDGSLVLWGLAGQGYPEFVRKALLREVFIPALERLCREAQERRLAVAGYISLPRSTEVVNALRLYHCPYPVADCDHHCGRLHPGGRPCDVVQGLQDRDLFSRLLAPGERSQLFLSRSSVVEEGYGSHQVAFFYLNVGEEIARVEVPLWVASRRELLELAHGGLLDQCRRGQGYPVALGEAHEQAVVTAREREEFRALLDRALAGKALPVYTSEKARSKQFRWL